MPYPKDGAKMTGDTHLPDVESGLPERAPGTWHVEGIGHEQSALPGPGRGDLRREPGNFHRVA